MSRDTVLILDKDIHTQWTLKTLLESERYIALSVDSIDRAIQDFKEFEISALISEYKIDHLPIPGIIKELKKSFPELYVMILTHENIGEEEYKKMMSLGIDDCLVKPVPIEKILLHLKKGLRKRKEILQEKRRTSHSSPSLPRERLGLR